MTWFLPCWRGRHIYRKYFKQITIAFTVSFICILCIMHIVHMVSWRYRTVPVVIVEESHEVLPYWFSDDVLAAGPIAHTLVHIDAFSDEGLPDFFSEYPLFKWPINQEQVHFLMQSHVNYVQSAVMSGLIKHVVWIWPSWDKNVHRNDYERVQVEIGWTYIKKEGKSASETLRLCECRTLVITQEGTKPRDRICVFINQTPRFKQRESQMDGLYCRIAKIYFTDYIKDDYAIEHLTERNFLSSQVLLNIDESYFGLEPRVEQLMHAGVSRQIFKIVNGNIKIFMCPKNIEEELVADQFLQEFLYKLIKSCEWDIQSIVCESGIFEMAANLELFVLQYVRNHLDLFCSNDNPSIKSELRRLISSLLLLSKKALLLLIDIGFCLETSPKTLGFEADGEFKVCTGMPYKNAPKTTALEMLENGQYLQHFYKLQKILAPNVIPKPTIVTLSRSVRTGLTPPFLSPLIEDEVIALFNRSHISNSLQLVYDKNLLGGRKGWYHRKRNRPRS